MPPRPVNPTAPILLTLVTLLFAVTWNYDRPAVAAPCLRPHTVGRAVVPAPAEHSESETRTVRPVIIPVSAARPLTWRVVAKSNSAPARPNRPTWLPTTELPIAAGDWLSRLIQRAESGIQR